MYFGKDLNLVHSYSLDIIRILGKYNISFPWISGYISHTFYTQGVPQKIRKSRDTDKRIPCHGVFLEEACSRRSHKHRCHELNQVADITGNLRTIYILQMVYLAPFAENRNSV